MVGWALILAGCGFVTQSELDERLGHLDSGGGPSVASDTGALDTASEDPATVTDTGTGPITDTALPSTEDIGELGSWVEVTAGYDHTCARSEAGQVSCFGRNDEGQSVDPVGTYQSVSAGLNFTCAVDHLGEVSCWGDGMAHGVESVNGAEQVSAGAHHACALAPDQLPVVQCWGDNLSGELGAGSDLEQGYHSIHAGGEHTCGLAETGQATCWGHDIWGVDALDPSEYFLRISTGSQGSCGIREGNGDLVCGGDGPTGEYAAGPLAELSLGHDHVCAIHEAGDLACWATDETTPLDPPAGFFEAVSVGWHHACAIDPDGTLHCWGDNQEGQAPDQLLPPPAP